MHEVVPAIGFIMDTLEGYGALTALVPVSSMYVGSTPESKAYPFVIVTFIAGTYRRSNGEERLLTELLFNVKAVTRSHDVEQGGLIAAQIDNALDSAAGAFSFGGNTYQVTGVIEEAPIAYTEIVASDEYQHVGGNYRLYVS